MTLSSDGIELPDILMELQNRTQLTRRSIYRILTESKRLPEFKHNPQRFIEQAADVINRAKRHALVDGINTRRSATASTTHRSSFRSGNCSATSHAS